MNAKYLHEVAARQRAELYCELHPRFPTLLQQPLWRKELRAVSSGTEADMRKESKDYCRDKVKQFA
jgi:hypothetical protein